MRLIWELAKRAFQRQLSYRAAAIAGLATNLFFGLLRAAFLTALYNGRPSVAGISLQGVVTFTAITQAMIDFSSLFGWYQIIQSVNTGEIASDLLKPMGYYRFWLAQESGRAAASFLMRGLPLMVFYAFFFRITYPQSAGQWLGFGMALTLGWLLSYSFRFLVNLSAFWIPNPIGVARSAFFLPYFLSGFLLPMRLFPDWFQELCALTPFPHIVNTVVEAYLGVIQGPELVQALLLQAFWLIVLVGAGQIVLRAGVRKLVIQGG